MDRESYDEYRTQQLMMGADLSDFDSEPTYATDEDLEYLNEQYERDYSYDSEELEWEERQEYLDSLGIREREPE